MTTEAVVVGSLESTIDRILATPIEVDSLRADLEAASRGRTPVRRASAWMMVSDEVLEDAEAMRSVVSWLLRAGALERLGFRGRVRCYRCRRPVRCVYPGDYGRACWSIVLGLRDA